MVYGRVYGAHPKQGGWRENTSSHHHNKSTPVTDLSGSGFPRWLKISAAVSILIYKNPFQGTKPITTRITNSHRSPHYFSSAVTPLSSDVLSMVNWQMQDFRQACHTHTNCKMKPCCMKIIALIHRQARSPLFQNFLCVS